MVNYFCSMLRCLPWEHMNLLCSLSFNPASKCVLTRKIILFNPMLSILSPTTPYTYTHTEIIRNQSLFFQFTCNPQIASNYSQKSCFLQKVPFSILGVRKGVRKDGFMRPKDGFKRPFRTRPDQKYLFSQNDPFFATMDPSRLICCGVVGLPQALE